MANVFVISILCLLFAGIALKVSTWRRNYAIARSSGLPVFYSPVHITDWWWLMIYPIVTPFLKLLPHSWLNPWLPMAQVWNIWKAGHKPFKEVNSDSFILATPTGNMLWTCDPAIVHQLFTQHDKVQVPVDMVKFYDLWGPTIASVEGDEWKTHRRVITSGFNPAMNSTVWKEAIHQTQTLMKRWVEEGSVVPVVKKWTSRLALHVISGAFFNKSLSWQDCTQDAVPAPPGHMLSYEESLFTVLARLGTLFLAPRVLLASLPMRFFKEAHTAFSEWTKYMQELRTGTLDRMDEVASQKYKSLLESIVIAGTPDPTRPESRPLPENSILGNIFFTLFARHETTGNTMAFTLLLLAVYPEDQRKVQAELDHQLDGRQKDQWTVERDYQVLQQGYLGAVLKEVLRLYCVVQFLLRRTVTATPVVDLKGSNATVPENSFIILDFAAAFKNPSTWSESKVSPERRAELHDSPAIHFDPSRWLQAGDVPNDEGLAAPTYWPFGQGPRQCPGKGFAQLEMTAVMATIFKEYSIELVVDEQTTNTCGGDSNLAWAKTRDKALKMLIDNVEANINIQMLKELPIRVVKRAA